MFCSTGSVITHATSYVSSTCSAESRSLKFITCTSRCEPSGIPDELGRKRYSPGERRGPIASSAGITARATSLCQPLYPPRVTTISSRPVKARLSRIAWAVASLPVLVICT